MRVSVYLDAAATRVMPRCFVGLVPESAAEPPAGGPKARPIVAWGNGSPTTNAPGNTVAQDRSAQSPCSRGHDCADRPEAVAVHGLRPAPAIPFSQATPSDGAVFLGNAYRGCRCALPPATTGHPFGTASCPQHATEPATNRRQTKIRMTDKDVPRQRRGRIVLAWRSCRRTPVLLAKVDLTLCRERE